MAKQLQYKIITACRYMNTLERVYKDKQLGFTVYEEDEFLNKEAQDGWELVSVVRVDASETKYYFQKK